MKEMNSLIAHRNGIEKNVVSNSRVFFFSSTRAAK